VLGNSADFAWHGASFAMLARFRSRALVSNVTEALSRFYGGAPSCERSSAHTTNTGLACSEWDGSQKQSVH
jgi:hypothetical protein